MTHSHTLEPNSPVQFLKGVGPKRAAVLKKTGIVTVLDLLYYFPRRHLDRTSITPIKNLEKGKESTIVAKVEAGGMRRAQRRKYYELIINDGSGLLNCRWFNGAHYIQKVFSVGDEVAFHGRVDYYKGYQLVHPEYDILSDEESEPLNTGGVIPLYSSSENLKKMGLESIGFRRIVRACIDQCDLRDIEFLPDSILETHNLLPLKNALKYIHFAPNGEKLDNATYRLKFDEHFFLQLLMALRKRLSRNRCGRVIAAQGPYLKKIFNSIDFNLTEAQKRIFAEIRSDIASEKVMNRLVQGDVGAGKTIIAILASAVVVGNGFQVAVMAPTEILAHQHYRTFNTYFRKVQVPIALVVGKQNLLDRKNILSGVNDGRIKIVIGTHAIIQDQVIFQDLGLIIIDEQQRFGVLQRGKLVGKGLDPHLLSMTATPIPRTLANTYHGDMDLSLLDEMPKHRQKVTTRVVNGQNLEKVYNFMMGEIKKGRQCMVVYPLIDESEKIDLEAAVKGCEKLRERFSMYSVALLHGRMKRQEKDEIMVQFSRNNIQLLVSTTVVEVGIDVPNATVMLIENAERFGLTQLHQLRGRIGRGTEKSICVLCHRRMTENSKKRLEIMQRCNDGFEISDEDLKLRGPGEFYGTRQHGYPQWKIADIVNDGNVVNHARSIAYSIVNKDPNLGDPIYRKIRLRFVQEYQEMLEMINIA